MAAVPAGNDVDPWGGDGDGLAVPVDGDADPAMTATDVTVAAETALLGFAADFAPGPLRRLGTRILDHVAPQAAERLEAKALERAERRAWPQRGFSLSPSGGGLVRVGGHLTVEDAAIVSAALDPLSGPGVDADSRTPPNAALTPWSKSVGSPCAPASCPTPAANRHSWPSRWPTTR